MEQREIKFRIISAGKIIGYERLVDGEWTWMCPELNPDNGERWTMGSFPVSTGDKNYQRQQYFGLLDKKRVEIYEGDLLEVETKGKLFTGEVKWNTQSASFIISKEKKYLEIISCAQSSDSNEYVVIDQAEIKGNKLLTP